MDSEVKILANSDEQTKRLQSVPGVGPLTATAFVATIGSAQLFENGRNVSSFLGLVPRQHSSGGKARLLGITKRGDKYLRKLLVHGARATIRFVTNRTDPRSQWIKDLVERRGFNKAAVALANKNARVLWALMMSGNSFEIAA